MSDEQNTEQEEAIPDYSDAAYEELMSKFEADDLSEEDSAEDEIYAENGADDKPEEDGTDTPEEDDSTETEPEAGKQDGEEKVPAPAPVGKSKLKQALKILGYNYDDAKDEDVVDLLLNDIGGNSEKTGSKDSAPGTETSDGDQTEKNEIQFARDFVEITKLFPQIGLTSADEIANKERFAFFRNRGLSVEEAFVATNAAKINASKSAGSVKADADTKAHLRSNAPKGAASAEHISRAELDSARELFGDGMTDAEIAELWRRAHK